MDGLLQPDERPSVRKLTQPVYFDPEPYADDGARLGDAIAETVSAAIGHCPACYVRGLALPGDDPAAFHGD